MYLAYQSDSVLLPLGLGEIGYLVNSDKRKYSKYIKQIIENKFRTEDISKRSVISCPTVNPDWPVFNEIAISKTGSNTLLEFKIKFNDQSIDLKADGIVVLTYADKSFMKHLPFVGEKFRLFEKEDLLSLTENTNLRIIDSISESDEIESKTGDRVLRKYTMAKIRK